MIQLNEIDLCMYFKIYEDRYDDILPGGKNEYDEENK